MGGGGEKVLYCTCGGIPFREVSYGGEMIRRGSILRRYTNYLFFLVFM